jgi:hypothetical protein
MEKSKIIELENIYGSIKTKALGGHRISRKEALEALRIKKLLDQLKREGNNEKLPKMPQ